MGPPRVFGSSTRSFAASPGACAQRARRPLLYGSSPSQAFRTRLREARVEICDEIGLQALPRRIVPQILELMRVVSQIVQLAFGALVEAAGFVGTTQETVIVDTANEGGGTAVLAIPFGENPFAARAWRLRKRRGQSSPTWLNRTSRP